MQNGWRIIGVMTVLLMSCAQTTPQAANVSATPEVVQPTSPAVVAEPTQAVAEPVQATSVENQSAPTTIPFQMSSPDFANGQPIPKRFTCDSDNVSPAISWEGTPDNTRSLALIVEDIDAPSGIFVHWTFYDLSPAAHGQLPQGPNAGPGVNGQNTFNQTAYGGPCPPAGKVHRYIFHLYALDINPDLPSGLTAAQLREKMDRHILAESQWMGTYQR